MAKTNPFNNTSPLNTGVGATSPKIPKGKTTPTQLQTILYNQEYGTYLKQAVAEQNQTYFAYFDGVGGTGPEIIDQTAYFIKYIIDDQGNPVNPEPDFAGSREQAVGLYNLLDDYEVGKRAIIKLIEPNPIYDDIPKNSDVLTGIHKITGVGRIASIAVTEIGKKIEDYIDTMSFGPTEVITTEAIVPDLYFTSNYLGGIKIIKKATPSFDDYGVAGLEYTSVNNSNPAWEVYTPPGHMPAIRILSSSDQTYTRIRFNITAYVGVVNPADDWYENHFKFGLGHSNSSLVSQNIYNSSWYWIGEDNAGYFTYVTPWIDSYNINDVFSPYIQVQSPSDDDTHNDYTDGAYVYFKGQDNVSGTRIIVEQEISPTTVVDTEVDSTIGVPLVNGVNAIYSPFFTASINIVNSDPSSSGYTPNNSYSYLILSPAASNVFSSNLIQNIDSASLEMGFSPIKIPFGDVRPGDWIRFEYDKTRTYNIIGVGAYNDFVSGSTDYPNLVVFQIAPNIGQSNIAPGAQINHFVIYRIINDGSYVILDINKDVPGGAYSGIIQPEYVSTQLTTNYDKIIQNLTEKEIIQ